VDPTYKFLKIQKKDKMCHEATTKRYNFIVFFKRDKKGINTQLEGQEDGMYFYREHMYSIFDTYEGHAIGILEAGNAVSMFDLISIVYPITREHLFACM
jgi:hypothetical protein